MEQSKTVDKAHTSLPGTPPEVQAGAVSAGSPGFPGEKAEANIHSGVPAGEPSAGQRATDETREELQQYANTAKEAVQSAKEQGMSMLEERKRALADEVSGVERALRRTATQLRDEHQSTVGRYAEQAADGLEHLSHALREQDFDALIEKTEDFARRQPGVFLGGAVAAGFLLARFLKSSGRRVAPGAGSSVAPSSLPEGYRQGTGRSAYETAGVNPQASYGARPASPSVESSSEIFTSSDRDSLRGAE